MCCRSISELDASAHCHRVPPMNDEIIVFRFTRWTRPAAPFRNCLNLGRVQCLTTSTAEPRFPHQLFPVSVHACVSKVRALSDRNFAGITVAGNYGPVPRRTPVIPCYQKKKFCLLEYIILRIYIFFFFLHIYIMQCYVLLCLRSESLFIPFD